MADGRWRGIASHSRFRRISVAVLCVALAAVAGATRPHPATPARQEIARPGVVLVSTESENAQGGGLVMRSADSATGIVLTADGEILTNNHVIEGATSVTVTDPAGGRRYHGSVVGYSVADDIALIRLEGASGLTPAPLGDSRGLRVGASVTAVGNAHGGGRLVAVSGAVVPLGRTIEVRFDGGMGAPEPLSGVIVDDARIVPGDSGGPLLDAAGRVVGVDAAASDDGPPFSGMAIPIDRALAVVARIRLGRSEGTVHDGPTATLGYESDPMYGYKTPPGCSDAPGNGLTVAGDCVMAAEPGSPAAALGLDATGFDVVVGLDGIEVASHQDVVRILMGLAPGRQVTVGWISEDGRHHQGTATLAQGPPY